MKKVSSNMITVGIIEDDADIREGIRRYVNNQKDFLCDIAAGSVEDFFSAVMGKEMPDVVLSDIGLPGMSGIKGMQIIKEQHPDTDIIMLTIYNDWQRIFDSLCAGASGYLLKNSPLAEIKKAIQTVREGGAAMSPDIARKVMDHFSKNPAIAVQAAPERERVDLTAKEQEIVAGLVDGLSYKLLADRMGLSIDTIRFHIKNVYRKLHVNSKGEVISKSLRGEI
jgi:DNA-binding NarL/FixJ family response regulator